MRLEPYCLVGTAQDSSLPQDSKSVTENGWQKSPLVSNLQTSTRFRIGGSAFNPPKLPSPRTGFVFPTHPSCSLLSFTRSRPLIPLLPHLLQQSRTISPPSRLNFCFSYFILPSSMPPLPQETSLSFFRLLQSVTFPLHSSLLLFLLSHLS